MYSMKQACEQLGINYDTLKFYCRAGLVPDIKRNSNNYRYFNDEDIAWIRGLLCLKHCGMGIREMRSFVELCQLGHQSIPERLQILSEKQKALKTHIADLKLALDFIEYKRRSLNEALENQQDATMLLTSDNNEKFRFSENRIR